MRPFAQSWLDIVDMLDHLLDDAQDRVSYQFGLLPQFFEINITNVKAEFNDLLGSLVV
jgi:hypothetical protein